MTRRPVFQMCFIAMAISLFAACGHKPSKNYSHNPNSPTYQNALDKAFGEMEQMTPRKPAQTNGFNLSALNKVKPGKFKVFVFPKINSMTSKSAEDESPLFANEKDEKMSRLGKPQEFEVSTVAENPCFQFITGGLFAKLNAKDYFNSSLAEPKNRRCAILEVTSLKISKANRALIRRDDLLRTRVYLDDTYRVYGYEIEKFIDGQNTRLIKVKADGAQSASSGLTLFPIDIPSLDLFQTGAGKAGSVPVSSKVDGMSLAQIRKMQGDFSANNCNGYQLKYTDYYGQAVEVGWCDGVPFPQYMENSRFVAITQPLSVR
ncbi:MAG: hypothetical protein AB7O96_15090 [Pseudobdellovibrionaceae bacterium]